MKPIGPLMWEHRVIENMVVVMNRKISTIVERNEVEVPFIDEAVEFFQIYSDRTHHGKEEEILFRDLTDKALSTGHRRMMDVLIEDHKKAREMVRGLVEAKERYVHAGGDAGNVVRYLQAIVAFYPAHIEKEDKEFFFPCLTYFSEEEQGAMLREFYEFDRRMIHEKYRSVVERLSGQSLPELPK